MGFEVVATGEAALALRNPADIWPFSLVAGQMTL
jgi:hypothetical protein